MQHNGNIIEIQVAFRDSSTESFMPLKLMPSGGDALVWNRVPPVGLRINKNIRDILLGEPLCLSGDTLRPSGKDVGIASDIPMISVTGIAQSIQTSLRPILFPCPWLVPGASLNFTPCMDQIERLSSCSYSRDRSPRGCFTSPPGPAEALHRALSISCLWSDFTSRSTVSVKGRRSVGSYALCFPDAELNEDVSVEVYDCHPTRRSAVVPRV